MAGYVTVQQGEYLSLIAYQHGFQDHRIIWDHPENASLKAKRKNPNVLFPGDELFIPDLVEKEETKSTDQHHRFVITVPKLKLRIVLRKVDNTPFADTPCELQVAGKTQQLKSDAKGLIEQEIPKTSQDGHLFVKAPDEPAAIDIPIKIGDLDPVEEPSGQMMRLNNLGYNAGLIDTPAVTADAKRLRDERFRSAIEEFQCDNGLKVDGVCGPQTQSKLKDVHGC